MSKCLTPAADRAYLALVRAAERIGLRNYLAQRRGKGKRWRYQPTEAHRRVVEDAARVCGGRITPDEAMATLHEYDVMRERFPKKSR